MPILNPERVLDPESPARSRIGAMAEAARRIRASTYSDAKKARLLRETAFFVFTDSVPTASVSADSPAPKGHP